MLVHTALGLKYKHFDAMKSELIKLLFFFSILYRIEYFKSIIFY